jgi:hypothetical protein
MCMCAYVHICICAYTFLYAFIQAMENCLFACLAFLHKAFDHAYIHMYRYCLLLRISNSSIAHIKTCAQTVRAIVHTCKYMTVCLHTQSRHSARGILAEA